MVPKGLYKKARLGEIKNFTGISAVYDEPKNPDITIDTETLSELESSDILSNYIEKNFAKEIDHFKKKYKIIP